jgi:integrase
VEPLRVKLNVESRLGGPITINAFWGRYIEQETSVRPSTRRSYLSTFNRWIKPRWGDYLLDDVKTVAVESWLRPLPLAPKSKTHIRNLMHLLYQNARRWEYVDRNPIELVRQSSRRLRIPRVLTAGEIRQLLAELSEPYHSMVLVAACLGLRVSEIIGLQWGDFDWDKMTVLVQRAVVQCQVGETKTEGSCRPLPVHPDLAACLQDLHSHSSYGNAGDWVFANDAGRPRWQETILKRQLKPAAMRAGIGKIGWHTFRHTYSTMLRSAGTDIKVQQELLRHANIQTTMNIYTQAVSDQKRAANSKVVEMVFSGEKTVGGTRRFANGSRMGADGNLRGLPQSPLSD